MDSHAYVPLEAEDFDDMLVEYKDSALPSKSDFEATVAAVEFMFPRFKGRLSWARQVIVGWSAVHIPRHTVPIGEGQCRLAAVHMCSMRYPRLGVGMSVQQKVVLRSREMPSLTTASVSLPVVSKKTLGLAGGAGYVPDVSVINSMLDVAKIASRSCAVNAKVVASSVSVPAPPRTEKALAFASIVKVVPVALPLSIVTLDILLMLVRSRVASLVVT